MISMEIENRKHCKKERHSKDLQAATATVIITNTYLKLSHK